MASDNISVSAKLTKDFESWEEKERRLARWWLAGLVGVGLVLGTDFAMDWHSQVHSVHLALELASMFVLAWMAVAVIRRQIRYARALRQDLGHMTEQAQRWRKEAEELLRGLAVQIDLQFDRWELTQAEREVGFLLLKGLSSTDIANVRSTSERTARDQARAIYRKSGLAGRSELSAFFLEDLLMPSDTRNLKANDSKSVESDARQTADA